MSLDLSTAIWQLEGWRPWEWALPIPIEAQNGIGPDIGPVDARIPGSVRGALIAAGVLPDPYVRDNSLAGEFIENRHWIFRSNLRPHLDQTEGDLRLDLDLVDGPCIVRWNGQEVARYENAFVPLVAILPTSGPTGPAVIELIFLETPSGLGQVGRTSTIRSLKPRFSSGWDWIPRMAHIGVANSASVTSAASPRIARMALSATPLPGGGALFDVSIALAIEQGEYELLVEVQDARGMLVERRSMTVVGESSNYESTFALDSLDVWSIECPHLYRLKATVKDASRIHHEREKTLGYRSLRWEQTKNAPPDAEPWLLLLNDQPVFLAGINWVPIRADYSDVEDNVYEERLRLYRDLGFNLIRVWGGAPRERDVFYDLCDQLGLLVWQDLPLSSSGLDNYPPDDSSFVEEFEGIAVSYLERLGDHPSLIVWAGGNELSGAPELTAQPGSPLDFTHPALRAARRVLVTNDQRKVVPATPSGPSYTADPSHFGQGVHHDVHGPWAHDGSDEEWKTYWRADDSLLRSEVGIAGASPLDILTTYGLLAEDDDRRLTLWRHSSKWWLRGSERPTEEWVAESQARQAHLLSAAVDASLEKFPRCAGFFIWMGHDAFPCAVSLAVVDFWGRPKPAGAAIAAVLSHHGRTLGRGKPN